MNVPSNSGRRRFLGYAVTFLGGIGAALGTIPFLRSWRNRQPIPTLDVDVSKMVDGQLIAVQWPFGPNTVYILKRSPAAVASLRTPDPKLADANSDESQQPVGAKNPLRSIRPDFLVVGAHCTHLGCNVGHVAKGQVEWFPVGGFMCPCHGSMYDFAGRVYQHQAAPTNLVVPKYRFLNDHTIQLGRE